MTNRISYTPQDFQKMCKQAERDHETKKLVYLLERLKRQLAERSDPQSKAPTGQTAISMKPNAAVRLPIRSVPLER